MRNYWSSVARIASCAAPVQAWRALEREAPVVYRAVRIPDIPVCP